MFFSSTGKSVRFRGKGCLEKAESFQATRARKGERWEITWNCDEQTVLTRISHRPSWFFKRFGLGDEDWYDN